MIRELEALRSALAGGGSTYLLDDRFSYADITMAVTLQFVAPVANEHIPLGPATRASCMAPTLAASYSELVAWRDALYGRHRSA